MTTDRQDDESFVQVRCDTAGCDRFLLKYHRSSHGWIRMSIPCKRCGELKHFRLNLGQAANQPATAARA